MINEIIILGTNEIAYLLARNYHELYNKKATIFGHKVNNVMSYTKIADISIIPSLLEERTFLKILKEFYLLNQKDKIMLIPTNVEYINLLNKVKDKLDQNYLMNIPNNELIEILTDQEKFKSTYKNKLNISENSIISAQDRLYEITAYVGSDSNTKVISFGEVSIKDGIDNPLVITSSYDEFGYKKEILDKISSFLEKIEYKGFAQILLKRNEKMDNYEVIKIIPNLSMTGYLLTACGYNCVKLLEKDIINKEPMSKKVIENQFVINLVPYNFIRKYTKSILLKQQTFYLIDNGKSINPFKYNKDKSIGRKFIYYKRNKDYKERIK